MPQLFVISEVIGKVAHLRGCWVKLTLLKGTILVREHFCFREYRFRFRKRNDVSNCYRVFLRIRAYDA